MAVHPFPYRKPPPQNDPQPPDSTVLVIVGFALTIVYVTAVVGVFSAAFGH